MKRFWKSVTITQVEGSGYGIALDERPVRTPGRALLHVPAPALADAIAEEWRAVADELDPRAMILTGLSNAAIDRVAPDPATFAAGLAVYGESDLLCYRADSPDELVARQQALWEPHLEWARTRYDVHFARATGIMHVAQPDETVTRLAEAVIARNSFTLAALSPIVSLTGSLVLALALAEGAADADTIWTAASLDEEFQAGQWGRDTLAEQARADKRIQFDAAVRFLKLLDPDRS
ncbi:ATPase [Stakelama sediminis]|uniref:Chaperone required for assembly of F1-ATPase n=1 Tax=Stakelama sediminis TaxID=463200 RepID=A0A840Z0E8_9SPHN|nr:ATP12 family protein [Stakelama sediminis]MBB5719448.1 chaperone required for assembly of F1-ATPase [Stakelama sediminis]